MKAQTALYTWTAPDGTPRYLIDPAEWQDGQWWSRNDPETPTKRSFPPKLPAPVWVRELLPIPEPLPEVHWIDGHTVAMFHLLPTGTGFMDRAGVQPGRKKEDAFPDEQPVIVVSWPDGSKPVPPTVDDDLPPDDLSYKAWVLLANVSDGDWTKQTPEWQEAVVRWRDEFHTSLDGRNMAPPTVDGAR